MLILSESLPECKLQMLFFAFASKGREGTAPVPEHLTGSHSKKTCAGAFPQQSPKCRWRGGVAGDR